MITMATVHQKSTIDTQKLDRKEHKHTIKENNQNTRTKDEKKDKTAKKNHKNNQKTRNNQKTTDPARKEPGSVPRADLGEPPREAKGLSP